MVNGKLNLTNELINTIISEISMEYVKSRLCPVLCAMFADRDRNEDFLLNIYDLLLAELLKNEHKCISK